MFTYADQLMLTYADQLKIRKHLAIVFSAAALHQIFDSFFKQKLVNPFFHSSFGKFVNPFVTPFLVFFGLGYYTEWYHFSKIEAL